MEKKCHLKGELASKVFFKGLLGAATSDVFAQVKVKGVSTEKRSSELGVSFGGISLVQVFGSEEKNSDLKMSTRVAR